MGFGGGYPFPKKFGGGRGRVKQIQAALLEPLSKFLDTSTDGEAYVEAMADAVAIASIWAASGRLRGFRVPARMLETLPDWEKALGIKPSPGASLITRRAAVAAAKRGLNNAALGDIEAAAREVLGDNLDTIVTVDPVNEVAYWPGVNPGPPGFEWSTNRAIVGIRMNKTGLSDQAFLDKRNACAVAMSAILPAWMTFSIGVGSSFVVGVGIVGQTFL